MAAAIPLTSGPALANPAEAKPQLMFMQTAEDMEADDKTLHLINVGKQTLYFSDRPVRIAGHVAMPAYLEE